MLLNVERVSASIAGVTVLRGVDIGIKQGETIALVGRNGAGKTSLLRTVMGLLPITEGCITLAGEPISTQPAHLRAACGIGYGPEDRRLVGKFSVMENILVPAWASGLSEKIIAERLELIFSIVPELKDHKDRPGGLLSGGQQKMVALGRALMVGTKLVLLDEPFQGLAPVLALRYAETLRALRRSQPDLGILITESNPKLLTPMVDRLFTIERGVISET